MMKRRGLVIMLCCLALPYLYWHMLIAKFTPVNYLQQYVKMYVAAFDNSLTRSILNKSDQNNSDVMSSTEVAINMDTQTPENDTRKNVLIVNEVSEASNPAKTDKKEDSELTDSDKIESAEDDNEKPDTESVPLKKILVWNKPRTAPKNFGLGSGQRAFLRFGCEYNACTVTNKRKLYPYEELDAVIWHQRSKDRSFPPKRSPHTRYIFMNAEPPGHVKRMASHRKRFNWTLTYRWDSDISMKIGQIIPTKNGPKKDNSHINYAEGKTKMAAWFVSNCGTDSGRSKITKQLQKYFPVDVYGKCGPMNCPRFTKVDCYKKAERKYKFYLSFENSLCKDYVTEKFFKVLLYNMVPVVYGGANYKAIAPRKSFINVRDFTSVKALADYLLYLNSNDTAYNEYFRWKRHYDVLAVSGSKNLAWCDLCKKLHTDSKTRVYSNIRDWFIKQARCQTTKSKRIRNFVNGL